MMTDSAACRQLVRRRSGARVEDRLAAGVGATIPLYERGPAVKLGNPFVTSAEAGLTDPRIVDGIEQRSFLYGLLREGQGWMGGCSGGPIRYGVVKRPAG
jgi:hypothetical protein